VKKVTMTGCPCDIDERTELYCLNRLSILEAKRFESHLAVCPACLSEALETDMFLESLVAALEEMEEEESSDEPLGRLVRELPSTPRRVLELRSIRAAVKPGLPFSPGSIQRGEIKFQ
jgi:hypothetical protein